MIRIHFNADEPVPFRFFLSLCNRNFSNIFLEKKPRPLHMEDLKLLPGETARLNCSMVLQDHSFHIEWLRRAEVNGSYVDSTGAPLFEVLEVC